MKLAYILSTFPARSETFITREIEGMLRKGFDITILAVAKDVCDYSTRFNVVYRRRFFSKNTLTTLPVFFIRHPLSLTKLIILMIRLLVSSPREAMIIARNLHTIALFCDHLDHNGISPVHAGFLSWPACIGLAVCVCTGRKFSISAHARDFYVERGACSLKLSKAEFISVCSRQVVNSLRQVLPLKLHHKIHLNYHGISLMDARNIHSVSKAAKTSDTLVAVGRMVPKKGFDTLLRAFSIVLEKNENCSLLLIGSGPEQQVISELVGELGLFNRVRMTGWKEHEEVLLDIRDSIMLIVPSVIAPDGDRDGIPNVILEAFAARVPVIASNLPGIGEAVIDRQTGLLAEPLDHEGLALAILELLHDQNLQQRICGQAYDLLCDRFDLGNNVERLAELFRKYVKE